MSHSQKLTIGLGRIVTKDSVDLDTFFTTIYHVDLSPRERRSMPRLHILGKPALLAADAASCLSRPSGKVEPRPDSHNESQQPF